MIPNTPLITSPNLTQRIEDIKKTERKGRGELKRDSVVLLFHTKIDNLRKKKAHTFHKRKKNGLKRDRASELKLNNLCVYFFLVLLLFFLV